MGGEDNQDKIARQIGNDADSVLSIEQQCSLFKVSTTVTRTGYWTLNMLTEQVTWSDEVFRIHGYEPGEFEPDLSIGVKAYHPDDQATVNEALARSQETGEHFEFWLRIIRPTGEIRYVYSYGLCAFDEKGVVHAMYGVFMDETEKRRHTLKLEEQSARLSLATKAGNIGVWEYDLRDGKLTWDERMYRLYDVAPDTPENYDLWHGKIHPDDSARAAKEVDEAIERLQSLDVQFRIIHQNGEVRHIQANASVLKDPHTGRPLRMVGTNYDVTALQRAQELANEAKEREQSANRLKSDFIANMSHEIRTPMNGIVMALDMAADSNQNAEVTEYLDVAKSSVKNLLRIVNDVLDISKIESGKMTLVSEPFEAQVLLDDIVRLHSPVALKKDVSIALNVSGALPKMLMGDPTRLHQVLSNFVSNAVKFTAAGDIKIDVACTVDSANRAHLDIHVIDSGPGIAPEDQKVLFERFSQLGEGMARADGTGLGLAIAYQLAELMDGQVGINSDGKSWSDFWLSVILPVADDTPQIAGSSKSEKSALHILVAEDIPLNQMLIRRLLEKMGHSLVMANDGQEALEMMQADDANYDLLLLDHRMPRMSGLEATKRIRNMLGPKAKLPIIAVTADAMEEQRREFMAAGANGFVAKPLSANDLEKEIAKSLGW